MNSGGLFVVTATLEDIMNLRRIAASRGFAAIGAAITTALVVGGVAYAVVVVPPNSNDRYYACVSTTGAVKAATIKLNVVPTKCPIASDTVHSWSVGNPPSTTIRTATFHMALGVPALEATARCNPGETVTGGGFDADAVGSGFPAAYATAVNAPANDGLGAGWRVKLAPASLAQPPGPTVTVFANCITS